MKKIYYLLVFVFAGMQTSWAQWANTTSTNHTVYLTSTVNSYNVGIGTAVGAPALQKLHVVSSGGTYMKTATTTEARIQRNLLLHSEDGIYGTAQIVKHYIRGAFTNKREEVKIVTRIKFSKK